MKGVKEPMWRNWTELSLFLRASWRVIQLATWEKPEENMAKDNLLNGSSNGFGQICLQWLFYLAERLYHDMINLQKENQTLQSKAPERRWRFFNNFLLQSSKDFIPHVYWAFFFCNLTHKEIKRPRSPKKSVSVKYSHWLKPRNSLPKIEKSENFSSWLSLKPRKMGKKPLFENFEAGSFSWVAKVRARLLVWTLNWIGYDFRRPGIINFIPDHSADWVHRRTTNSMYWNQEYWNKK